MHYIKTIEGFQKENLPFKSDEITLVGRLSPEELKVSFNGKLVEPSYYLQADPRDRYISRVHAGLINYEGRFYVVDFGGTGTHLLNKNKELINIRDFKSKGIEDLLTPEYERMGLQARKGHSIEISDEDILLFGDYDILPEQIKSFGITGQEYKAKITSKGRKKLAKKTTGDIITEEKTRIMPISKFIKEQRVPHVGTGCLLFLINPLLALFTPSSIERNYYVQATIDGQKVTAKFNRNVYYELGDYARVTYIEGEERVHGKAFKQKNLILEEKKLKPEITSIRP